MMFGKKSFYTYLKEFVQEEPNERILGYYKGWLTNSELLERIESTAWAFRSHGVRRGSYVAVLTSRSPQSIIAMLALQTLGAVAVLTDPHKKVRDFLKDSGVDIPVSHILTNEDSAQGIWDGDNMVLIDCATEETVAMDPLTLPSNPCQEEDHSGWNPGFVIFTSGSTGKSKAVILCQANFEAAQIASIPLTPYARDDIALGILPMDHVFGLVLMSGTMIQRHALYLVKEAGLDNMMKVIQEVGITRMNGTPQLYLAMCAMKDKYDVSSLRAGLIGSAPFTLEQFCKIENDLGMTLCPVYGMSEFVAITSGDSHDHQEIRGSSNGPICDMNTGKILLDDGTEAEPGQVGEICVDGPPRMLGYFGVPESGKGMLHTGDLGYVDQRGHLHISGRKKDIIIRNGNNLSPRKIEEAILEVPGVKEVCVMGIPDDKSGEVPCAMVVSAVSQEKIAEHLRKVLAKNEMPQGFLFVESMPLLGSGKPDKQYVQKILTEHFKS